jgi:hypothetical protein
VDVPPLDMSMPSVVQSGSSTLARAVSLSSSVSLNGIRSLSKLNVTFRVEVDLPCNCCAQGIRTSGCVDAAFKEPGQSDAESLTLNALSAQLFDRSNEFLLDDVFRSSKMVCCFTSSVSCSSHAAVNISP